MQVKNFKLSLENINELLKNSDTNLSAEENKKIASIFDECNTDKEGESKDALTGMEIDDFIYALKYAIPNLYNKVSNLITEQKENAELKAYKKMYKEGDLIHMGDALHNIARIETDRLDESRLDEKSKKTFKLVQQNITGEKGETYESDLAQLSGEEKSLFDKTVNYLKKVPADYRKKISKQFMCYALKDAQGAYKDYPSNVKKEIFREAGGFTLEVYYGSEEDSHKITAEERDTLRRTKKAIHDIRKNESIEETHFDPAIGKYVKD